MVLVQFIVGKKPIYLIESREWKSLTIDCLHHMENSCLLDTVDSRVIEEDKQEEFIAVADLARQCLNMNGKQRHTMKEVAMALHQIKPCN